MYWGFKGICLKSEDEESMMEGDQLCAGHVTKH